MEKRLTSQQIEQLFNFTKKHLVEHYDVQVELVDHLANAIENQWKENPNILFEDALQIEFKKFGVFGFTGLVEQKQSELQKHYNKTLWREVLKFVSIPKVVLTVCLYFIMFNLVKFFQPISEAVIGALILLSFVYLTVDGFRLLNQIKKYQKKHQKSWLIQSVAIQFFSLPITYGFSLSYSFAKQFFEIGDGKTTIGFLYIMTGFGLFHFIIIYVLIFIIKPKLKNEIIKTEQRFQFA